MKSVGQEWPIVRLRYVLTRQPIEIQRRIVANVSDVIFLPMQAIGENGSLDLSYIREQEEVKSGFTQFFEGDVVVAKITPCFENGKGALVEGLIGGVGYGTTELHVLSPGPETHGRFLYYVTASGAFRKLGEANMTGAAGQKRVPDEFVMDYRISSPPRHMQAIIAGYLDRETARIDGLITAKQRLVELIAEKRRALITHAVTRGLDANVPFRESGVPWLGQIPGHWNTTPLRFVTSFLGGATPDKANAEYWNGNIPWVSPKDMKRDEIGDAEDHVTDDAVSESALQFIPVGSVLIVVRGMILAHSFPVAITTKQVTINQDMKALRCISKLNPLFLQAVFQGLAGALVALTDESAHGTKRLDTEVVGKFQIPLPPHQEQHSVVSYIKSETSKLDHLRTAAERTIALLKERRSALIAAAVTGQLYIPEAA